MLQGYGTLTRSVSRTLEYAYNDFCIAALGGALGGALGRAGDAAKYRARSENWRNVFRHDQTSALANGSDTGFAGFFQGRFANGSWFDQDPLACSNMDPDAARPCSLQSNALETFESSLWEYGL